jgi:hypothetical protein
MILGMKHIQQKESSSVIIFTDNTSSEPFVIKIHHSMQYSQDKWVPVTMARHILRLQMEEQPPKWRVPENILNKQSRRQQTRGGTPA